METAWNSDEMNVICNQSIIISSTKRFLFPSTYQFLTAPQLNLLGKTDDVNDIFECDNSMLYVAIYVENITRHAIYWLYPSV